MQLPAKFWMFLPVILLGSSVSMGGITMYLATSDESFAVEPNYDDQGTDVDLHLALRAKAHELAWSLRPVSRAVEVGDRQDLRFRLLDAQGQPLTGVKAEYVAFANSRASQRQAGSWQADPTEAGVYQVNLDVQRAGLWELRFRLTHDEVLAEMSVRTQLIDVSE